MSIEELMRAHPAHPGCDKHGEGLSGDGVVYVEGKALTVGAHQYCPRVYRGQGVPVGLEIHARVSRHSRHEHEHIRPSGACSIAGKMFARGRDDYSAITTILHAIYPWPPLLWRLRGVCVEGYGWIKATGRGGGGIWCHYFRTVPEDKERWKLHDIGAYGVGLANAAARAARGVCDQGP
jgi:hypothetical protein